MKNITLAWLLGLIGILFSLPNCSHQSRLQLDTKSARFKEFEKGFYALVEKELKQNPEASKPELKIEKISETNSELKIRYQLKYTESFADGEFLQRHTKGTAILKKNFASSEEEWVLDSLEGAYHKMIFKKGSKIGS